MHWAKLLVSGFTPIPKEENVCLAGLTRLGQPLLIESEISQASSSDSRGLSLAEAEDQARAYRLSQRLSTSGVRLPRPLLSPHSTFDDARVMAVHRRAWLRTSNQGYTHSIS